MGTHTPSPARPDFADSAVPTPLEVLDRALRRLAPADTLLVVTGAGISVASGIPTFRGTDPGAVWKQDVTTLGTYGFFQSDPVASWRWYLERFGRVLTARPNPAHEALAALERWHGGRGGRALSPSREPFLLVTQNVDTLHEQAGSRALVKVHGSADRVRCITRGCAHAAPSGSLARPDAELVAFAADPRPETLPLCPACGGLLRQHVLWFDEYYDSHADYRFRDVLEAAEQAILVLFVGTSFSVGVTDAIVSLGRRRGVPLLSIDPAGHDVPYGVTPVRARAEELLVAAVAGLVSN